MSVLGEDGKQYPSHFGSITLNEVESCYSQAKLELYGLFHALHAVCVYIFSLINFTVEVDVKYIKGMINNPDLQPNVMINHWITGVLLFSFKLMHIPTDKHAGADSLSHCLQSELDLPKDDNYQDWLDHYYSFSIEAVNDCPPPTSLSNQHHHSLPPPTYHQVSLLLPTSFYLTFSATADADNHPNTSDNPTILQSAKAQTHKAKIELISAFLVTHE
ncbi:hypothetical protein M404DRAFT_29162 [Pisolithus tinctorius Marx 270]|uniref:Reverse transcriptase RNase H-like domain-containing protein n=1 Tax=Pisolithus tinctorius Marx 270 TaxID=870435 RepID=A0A0C3P0C6_PISTI|nr:hypothetical protein M404DRAFT_29162 [Pisolithus tinctorius Marx 270]